MTVPGRSNTMSRMVFRLLVTLGGIALFAHSASGEGLSGRVLDEDGRPLEGALVRTSGVGQAGWSKTEADGAFRTTTAGAFISARLWGYSPVLVPVGESRDSIELRLSPLDDRAWHVVSCFMISTSYAFEPGRGAFARDGAEIDILGDTLRVTLKGRALRGPERGEGGSNWYVEANGHRLNIDSGPWLRSGLPPEKWMLKSVVMSSRSWIAEEDTGLDVRGRDAEGGYWRWAGPLAGESISYHGVSQEQAAIFDKIIDSACSGRRKE